jgi:hypothetical protein
VDQPWFCHVHTNPHHWLSLTQLVAERNLVILVVGPLVRGKRPLTISDGVCYQWQGRTS